MTQYSQLSSEPIKKKVLWNWYVEIVQQIFPRRRQTLDGHG